MGDALPDAPELALEVILKLVSGQSLCE